MLDKAIAIVALALAAPACHKTEAAERPGGIVVGQASGMTGGGALSFQDLSAIDNDKLQAGNLDELHADLTFQPEQAEP